MLDKNTPYFAESYSGSSATFRDFFANQEDAVKAAEAELSEPNVSMTAVQFREFDGGGYVGDKLLRLDCFPNLSRLQDGIAHGSIVIPRSLDLNQTLARDEVDLVLRFGEVIEASERLEPSLGGVFLAMALGRASEKVEGFERLRLDEYLESQVAAPDEPQAVSLPEIPNVLVRLVASNSTVEIRFARHP